MFDAEVWRKRWRRAEGQLLIAVDATAGPELEVMMAAADEAAESINRRYRSLTLWNPMVSTAGPVTFIDRSRKWADVEQMLTEYAAALAAVGITGVLRDQQPNPPGGKDPFKALPGVALAVALDGDLVVFENEVRPRRLPDRAALDQGLSAAREWTDRTGADHWVKDQLSLSPIPEERLDTVLSLIRSRGTASQPARGWGWTVASETAIRSVEVGDNAHVVFDLKVRSGPANWEEEVSEMSGLLRLLSSSCQYGLVSAERSTAPTWDGLIGRQWAVVGAMAEAAYPLELRDEASFVRDAQVVQLLGAGHVVPALSDRWKVEELSSDRHLVSAIDVAAWHDENLTRDFIIAANADFGPLIPD